MRLCLDCGVDTGSNRPRCLDCQRAHQRHYDRTWRKVARAAIEAHVATNGLVCPGWGVHPHQVRRTQLTADHVRPLSAGGTGDAANVAVLCRSCNSAKKGLVSRPRDLRLREQRRRDARSGPLRVIP
jgi:5-methylcytosine-specific restriction enzyme A